MPIPFHTSAGYPLRRTAHRISFRMQTHDTKMWYFEDIVRRTRAAVVRAGGLLCGGVHAPPRATRRWTVLRSPHVHKKSREKFWMVTHRRIFDWDAPAASVDPHAPSFISRSLPSSVAVRVTDNAPGLMALQPFFETIQRMNDSESAALPPSDREDSADDAIAKASVPAQEQHGSSSAA